MTNASLSDSCNATLHYCFAIQLYSVNSLAEADKRTSITLHSVGAQYARKILSRLIFNLHFAATVFHDVKKATMCFTYK